MPLAVSPRSRVCCVCYLRRQRVLCACAPAIPTHALSTPHPRSNPGSNPDTVWLMSSRRASLEGDDAGPSSVDPLLAELLAEATDDASPSGAGAAAPISLGEVSVTLMAMQGWCGE